MKRWALVGGAVVVTCVWLYFLLSLQLSVKEGDSVGVVMRQKPQRWRIGIYQAREGVYQGVTDVNGELLKCYAQLHGYQVLPQRHPKCASFSGMVCWARLCSVKAYLTDPNNDLDWVVVVDADAGLVDLTRPLETYLPEKQEKDDDDDEISLSSSRRRRRPDYDGVFSIRWKNGNILSGGYMLRKSAFSISFLDDWVALGSGVKHACIDNMFLPLALLRQVEPDNVPCALMLNATFADFNHYYHYVACVKKALGPGTLFGHKKNHKNKRKTNAFLFRMDLIGHSWFNTISEDIGMKVSGSEIFVHGVKNSANFYRVDRSESGGKKIISQMCHRETTASQWLSLVHSSLVVTPQHMRQLVCHSDVVQALLQQPSRPYPSVFSCWPRCQHESEVYYFDRKLQSLQCGDIIIPWDPKHAQQLKDTTEAGCTKYALHFSD